MGKVHRVFLVDDHPILRDGLAQLIEEDPSLNVCGEAANVEAVSYTHLTLPTNREV